jgi:hypothetical protein
MTDGCALFTMFYGILFVISIAHPNPTRSSVCYDFLENGVSQVAIQLFDNYIFIQQIEAIKKISRWKKISIHIYIWIVLILPWAPAYLIVPFFYDTNSVSFLNVYGITLQIQLWGAIAYNFYFTFEFAFILTKMYSSSTVQGTSVNKAKIIAIKSIIHCFTSSIANILYVYVPVIGNGLYNIIILAGIHFLFNYKIEKTHRYISKISQSFRGSKHIQIIKPTKVYVEGSNNRIYITPEPSLSACRSGDEFETPRPNITFTAFNQNIRKNFELREFPGGPENVLVSKDKESILD